MELPLILLKFAGMFPRVIENDWKIIEGCLYNRVGKVSFGFLVFSVLFVILRMICFPLFLLFKNELLHTDTMFDIMGSKMWDGNYFVCDFLSVISVLSNHKRIKNVYNKMFLITYLYKIPQGTLKIPMYFLVGFLISGSGLVLSLLVSFSIENVMCCISVINVVIFACFCHLSTEYLALLQSGVHSADQAFLSKLQKRDLSDPKHFLNILLYKSTAKCTQIDFFVDREINVSVENCNPKLAFHLRLQEVIDSLVQEFMDSVGVTILIQIVNGIVSLTFGFYFIIKTSQFSSVFFMASALFSLYELYVIVAFVSMANILNREVSADLIKIILFLLLRLSLLLKQFT